MDNIPEYIGLDELLRKKMSAGKPVMPYLIPYFDDNFFDIYAGRFNSINKLANCNDRFELNLAKSLLYEVLNDKGKSEYKFLIHIINGIVI